MDITNTPIEIDKMKLKQLRRIIREAIEEVLAEAPQKTTVDYKNPSQPDKILDIEPSDAATINKLKSDSNVASVTMGTKKIKEGDIDELARPATGLQLVDPNIDTTGITKVFRTKDKNTGQVKEISLRDIIEYIKDNPGIEKKQIYLHFGFAKPQQADAIASGLMNAGVLVNPKAQSTTEPGEEQPEPVTGPEALFIGSGDPLAQYFDNVPNADGSEDFNDEEEPTVGDIEPSEPVTTGGMSDEDYEAFDKYDTLKTRLNGVKSNLNRMKRNKGKGGVAGDIADTSSTEEQNLRNLKKSLEDRINTLVAGSEYLQKKIEKETGKAYEPVEVEPEGEEEETIDEAFDAEYERRKLQFYAGIIK